MEINKKELGKGKFEIEVTYGDKPYTDNVKKETEKALANVTIKGFRKGKAPKAMALAAVNGRKVIEDAFDNTIDTIFQETLKESKLIPFIQPKVELKSLDPSSVKVVFTIVTKPTLTLGKYKGLGIKVDPEKVTDKEVDDAINLLLKEHGVLALKEGKPAAMGDTVIIDFLGKVEGKAFDGGEAKNYTLELGSKSFIEGFEEQLVGMKENDQKTIKVKFPDNYVQELAGKDATFDIVMHEIKEKKLPILDDGFIKELNDDKIKTVADLKKREKESLEKRKEGQAKLELIKKIMDKIKEDSKFEIVEDIIETDVQSNLDNLKQELSQRGLTFEDYLKMQNTTADKLREEVKKSVEDDLKIFLVTEEICEKENIKVEEKDITNEFERLSKLYGMEPAKLREAFKGNESRLYSQLKQNKFEEFIIKA